MAWPEVKLDDVYTARVIDRRYRVKRGRGQRRNRRNREPLGDRRVETDPVLTFRTMGFRSGGLRDLIRPSGLF